MTAEQRRDAKSNHKKKHARPRAFALLLFPSFSGVFFWSSGTGIAAKKRRCAAGRPRRAGRGRGGPAAGGAVRGVRAHGAGAGGLRLVRFR